MADTKRAAVHRRPGPERGADSAAPWQRAPPLDHVQVAAVRADWHELFVMPLQFDSYMPIRDFMC